MPTTDGSYATISPRGCSSTGIYMSPMHPYHIASNLTDVINSSDMFSTSVPPEIVNQVVHSNEMVHRRFQGLAKGILENAE